MSRQNTDQSIECDQANRYRNGIGVQHSAAFVRDRVEVIWSGNAGVHPARTDRSQSIEGLFEGLGATRCSGCSSCSYSYSASRYSYSTTKLYASIDSDTTSRRPINRVRIDTIRLSIRFSSPFDSSSIPSIAARTSWIDAHSRADPRAMSRNRLGSLRLRLPLPSAMFSGIDCAARSH